MCPFRDEFVEIRSLHRSVEISIANGETVTAAGIGIMHVVLKNKKPIRIEDVLYVPKLDRRLLSIPTLSAKGLICSYLFSTGPLTASERLLSSLRGKSRSVFIEGMYLGTLPTKQSLNKHCTSTPMVENPSFPSLPLSFLSYEAPHCRRFRVLLDPVRQQLWHILIHDRRWLPTVLGAIQTNPGYQDFPHLGIAIHATIQKCSY